MQLLDISLSLENAVGLGATDGDPGSASCAVWEMLCLSDYCDLPLASQAC